MMIIAYLNAIKFIEEELLHSSIFCVKHTLACLYVCIMYNVYIIINNIIFMCIAWTFYRVKIPKKGFLLIVRAPFKIELHLE